MNIQLLLSRTVTNKRIKITKKYRKKTWEFVEACPNETARVKTLPQQR